MRRALAVQRQHDGAINEKLAPTHDVRLKQQPMHVLFFVGRGHAAHPLRSMPTALP